MGRPAAHFTERRHNMNMLDLDAVTDEVVETLRDEAAVAGDTDTVDLCNAVLYGDDEAWIERCRYKIAEILADAEAALEVLRDDGWFA